MMGMGQQMPMRRPQMGPSPMTAGRPNPMAGFGGGYGGPPGGGGYGNLTAPRTGPPPPGWQQHNNVQAIQGDPNFQGPNMMPGYNPQAGGPQAMPLLQGGPGSPMGVDPGNTPQVAYPQFVDPGMTHPSVRQPNYQNFANQMQGAMGGGGMMPQMQNFAQGMQGAMRRRQFPGALGRGIMQAMAPPPQAPPPNPYAQNFASGWGG